MFELRRREDSIFMRRPETVYFVPVHVCYSSVYRFTFKATDSVVEALLYSKTNLFLSRTPI